VGGEKVVKSVDSQGGSPILDSELKDRLCRKKKKGVHL